MAWIEKLVWTVPVSEIGFETLLIVGQDVVENGLPLPQTDGAAQEPRR